MRLFFRADADPGMGTGHVMRCMALGQAWLGAGGDVVFATACTIPALLTRLAEEGFEVRGPAELGNPPSRDAWLVLDGYHFDAEYQRRSKLAGWRILTIDDMAHLPHYYSDAVLNQNIGAERYSYPREPYTRLLLGPSYALLRREFNRWFGWRREIPRIARRLLVTLGGSDPQRVTMRVVEAIRTIAVDGLETVIVAGSGCESFAELKRAADNAGLRLETNVNDMAPLLTWADMAVSGAGSTCWEMAFLGLPAAAIVVADNQRGVAAGLAEQGCAVNLGWHADLSAAYIASAIRDLAFDQHRREMLSSRASTLVDGLGAKRVIDALAQ